MDAHFTIAGEVKEYNLPETHGRFKIFYKERPNVQHVHPYPVWKGEAIIVRRGIVRPEGFINWRRGDTRKGLMAVFE